MSSYRDYRDYWDSPHYYTYECKWCKTSAPIIDYLYSACSYECRTNIQQQDIAHGKAYEAARRQKKCQSPINPKKHINL